MVFGARRGGCRTSRLRRCRRYGRRRARKGGVRRFRRARCRCRHCRRSARTGRALIVRGRARVPRLRSARTRRAGARAARTRVHPESSSSSSNGDDPGAADPRASTTTCAQGLSVIRASHDFADERSRRAGTSIQRDRSERRRPARSHGAEQAGALDLSERRFQMDRPPTTAPSREFQKHFTCLEGRRPAGTSRMGRRSETS
jgi:hypothetical protein